MAVILPGTKCSLSGIEIKPTDAYFSTSGVFLPAKDPLRKFCDTCMLWEHYAQWPPRERFARAYVEEWIKANQRNPFWWTIHLDDNVYISANPQTGIEEISVRLMRTGSDIRIPLDSWSKWVEHPESVTPNLHAAEMEALARSLPTLRDAFPTARAIVQAIDPHEKKTPRRR